MRTIVRHLARLENRFVPREDAESERLGERLRRARARCLQSIGEPYDNPPLLGNVGVPLTLGERILWVRQAHLRRRAASRGDIR